MSDEVVGHKTYIDDNGRYCHKPLLKSEADALWAQCEAAEARRVQLMPDEQSAIKMLADAQQRLKEFGWKESVYAPKDGRLFEVIEPGSTGIHKCSYDDEVTRGSFWIHSDGDLWPSHPLLFRIRNEEELS